MQSLLQILVVGEVQKRKYEGREFETQECECLLLEDGGEVAKVGVLRVPEKLRSVVKVGTFRGSFALQPSYKNRVIEAVLTGLQEVKKSGTGFVELATPKALA